MEQPPGLRIPPILVPDDPLRQAIHAPTTPKINIYSLGRKALVGRGSPWCFRMKLAIGGPWNAPDTSD